MSARTAQLLASMGSALGAFGVVNDPNGANAERAAKALSPTVPTTDSLATEHFLNTPQAEAMIDLTVSQSEWLQVVTVKPRDQRAGNIPRLVINDVVTEGVPENGGRTIATHPDTSEVSYNCAKYQATWFLTLEDVAEAAAHGEPDFEAKVRGAFAKAMGNDMARAALRGDTSLDSSSRLNRLLRQRDGWLKQARASANYGTTTRGSAWSRSLYPAMTAMLPDQFADDANLRWLHGRSLDESFTNYAQGLGDGSALRDRALLERTRFRPMGIDGLIVPQWPSDQGFAALSGTAVDPDVATDDADGTITFRVDTLFGGYSATHAGRRVKVTCETTGATETLTVADESSHLVIHTTGSLGQGTISETEANYTLDLADTTGIMLTNPRNLYVVICRKIRAYRKFEQEAERWRLDVFYEADFGIFQPDAMVLQEGVVPTSVTFGS
jgi:hypothetical protein